MAATADQPQVTLMLSVHGCDAFGPFFAALTMNRELAQWLLQAANIYRAAKAMSSSLDQMTHDGYMPAFFEADWPDDVPDEAGDAAKLEAIFAENRYPTDGWQPAAPDEVPEYGTVRFDYSHLVVDASPTYPDEISFFWRGCIKHTDVEIRTCTLKEREVRTLLAGMS